MNSRFLNWYTQAFGATLGVLVCIFAYVNGWMFVYGNINHNFDNMHINGILASYLLLPLCIITLCTSFVKLYGNGKYIFNISLSSINTFICMLTIIVGIIGTSLYFIIPSCFILEEIIFTFIKSNLDKNNKSEQMFSDSNLVTEPLCESGHDVDFDTKTYTYSLEMHIKSLETKKEMALNLLEKDADDQFINEITGLTIKDINELKRSLNNHKI